MKALTISRLPPILLIHLKRFSFHGPFTDKIDTSVIFPVTGLDLTRYMPSPLDPGIEKQYASAVGGAGIEKTPPPIYDLHAISNHFGSLSSGHCQLSLSFTQ
jgi:ubiquitin carboxyl-terminal hydrolase 8